jgi:hypothetical protein
MPVYFALFDTASGRCGLAWDARGIIGVQLPEVTVRQTRGRMLQRFPGAQEAQPAGEAQRAMEGIIALLRGAPLFIISNPELVIAPCKNGVIGAFPALNAPRKRCSAAGSLK